jgi:hypothetical protein
MISLRYINCDTSSSLHRNDLSIARKSPLLPDALGPWQGFFSRPLFEWAEWQIIWWGNGRHRFRDATNRNRIRGAHVTSFNAGTHSRSSTRILLVGHRDDAYLGSLLSLMDGSPEDFTPTTPFLHSAVTAAYLCMRWRHAPSYALSSLTNIFSPMCFQLVILQ